MSSQRPNSVEGGAEVRVLPPLVEERVRLMPLDEVERSMVLGRWRRLVAGARAGEG
jgi:hypothetical protein